MPSDIAPVPATPDTASSVRSRRSIVYSLSRENSRLEQSRRSLPRIKSLSHRTVSSGRLSQASGGSDAAAAALDGGGSEGRRGAAVGLLRPADAVAVACEDHHRTLLRRAVADAGRWAYGVVVAEVWCLSEDRARLLRPDGGWWVDPTHHAKECRGRGEPEDDEGCRICRLFDPAQRDYVEPKDVAPGEGLPGALWAEASVGNWTQHHRETLAKSILHSSTNDSELRHEITLSHFRVRHIVWRNVQQLHDDPDQPWNLRLKLLAELGLGWAAAVPFSMHGTRGIVIYMARDNVDLKRIQSEQNERYLRSATDLIGAATAFGGPRREAIMERRKELLSTLHRVRDRILEIRRGGLSLADVVDKAQQAKAIGKGQPKKRRLDIVTGPATSFQTLLLSVLEKSKGAGIAPPPAFGWKEATFSFICVLLTMSLLTFLHAYIHNAAGDNYAVAIGPNGALMCLLFGLTAAPASQPRNAIIGQTVSMTVSLSVASTDAIPLWLRQSLATALSIAVMAKLGATHPPAAASAAIFASGLVHWPSMGFLLVANCIAVISAAILNNLSSKRQYPTSWGLDFLGPVLAWCAHASRAISQRLRRSVSSLWTKCGGVRGTGPTAPADAEGATPVALRAGTEAHSPEADSAVGRSTAAERPVLDP